MRDWARSASTWLTKQLSSGGEDQGGCWWAEQGVQEMEGWIEEVVRKGGREGKTGIEGLSLLRRMLGSVGFQVVASVVDELL